MNLLKVLKRLFDWPFPSTTLRKIRQNHSPNLMLKFKRSSWPKSLPKQRGAIMGKRFKNVWVSSEEKMQLALNNTAMGFIFDDRGELEINHPFLGYQGKKQTRRFSNIKAISPFHQRPSAFIQRVITILLIFISVVAMLNVMMLIWFLTASNTALSMGISIMSWITAFALLTVVSLAWIAHLSALGPLGTSHWIKVAYLDEKNELQTVYFADASKLAGEVSWAVHKNSCCYQEIAPAQIG